MAKSSKKILFKRGDVHGNAHVGYERELSATLAEYASQYTEAASYLKALASITHEL